MSLGVRRLLRLPGRLRRAQDDVDDEIAFHLAMREAKLEAAGLTEAQARARARERFGDIATIRDECVRSERRLIQRERRMTLREEVGSDVRLALRSARRTRGFTATALLTIALGVGATTAVFSIVRGVLLRPLPYPDADRIVRVFGAVNNWDAPLSPPNFRDIEAQQRSLSAFGGFVWNEATVTGLGDPLRVMTAAVYGDFFGALGVRPALGRPLVPDETRLGAPRRAVVSYEFWVDHLGSERRLENLHITLRGGSYDVVGVMPPGFAYPSRAQIWIGSFYKDPEQLRTAFLWSGVGRLRPGVTLDAARADIDAVLKRVVATYGKQEAGVAGGRVRLLQEDIVGGHRRSLLFLFGAVALVLLIACVNVATAALARGEARRLELGIRAALGAGRGRLVRQTLSEHLVIAIMGGVLGVGVAVLLTRSLGALGPRATGLPRLREVTVDAGALLFGLAATLVAGTAIGLLPAWQAGRAELRGTLARGGGGNTGDGSRARRALVMAEVALAIALTVGAGLLIRSLRTLMSGDPGFDPHNVATLPISLPENKYTDGSRVVAYFDQLLAGVRAIPGVRAASIVNSVPFDGNRIGGGIVTDAEPQVTGKGADYRLTADDYFTTMRIPLVRGRSFGPNDTEGAQQVAVVTRAFANAAWPNENPIGRRFKWTPKFDNHDDWLTVVGVAENTKSFAADDGSGPAVYVSYRQRPERALEGVTLLVSYAGSERTVLAAVRRQTAALDRDVPIEFSSVSAVVAASVAYRRFIMLVMSGFGVFALFLAALGVFGVLAYSVARRQREIGVRIALGARRAHVVHLVATDGARAVVPGVVLGLIGAVLLTRTMRSMLYGVGTSDPVAFAGGLAALFVVAAVACFVPARRASRVDPVAAMRAE
jgi:predicted permease